MHLFARMEKSNQNAKDGEMLLKETPALKYKSSGGFKLQVFLPVLQPLSRLWRRTKRVLLGREGGVRFQVASTEGGARSAGCAEGTW